MEIGVVTTKKPWTMLVFVLVAINAICALTLLMGIANPLDVIATQPTGLAMPSAVATTQSTGTAALNIGALFLLILNVIVLYGLVKGHVWSWWLLTFATLISVGGALIGAVTGTALAILPLIINVVMMLALLKKEVIQTYDPKLNILPKNGVW